MVVEKYVFDYFNYSLHDETELKSIPSTFFYLSIIILL